ncbi:MAG: tetratricopeptide repeat protein [Rhodobacteraceae bacterium]|nr:tetratricopeptide repeat protein [Paracoccaceae bacterium]
MKIFLSAVSSQFKDCREKLRSDLSAVGAEVVVQEDFQQHGGSLLENLERYIAGCDRVIALIGDAYAYEPDESARPPGSPRRSYSQWELFFARGERLDGLPQPAKDLFVYFAAPEFIAGNAVGQSEEAASLQSDFTSALRRSGKDWGSFNSLDGLRALVLRDGFRLDDHDPQLRDAPRAVVRGNQNIVVQIAGDGNHVDIHHPHLSLLRHGQLSVRDGIGLLYAQARAIPLFGRDETLQSLEAWANCSASSASSAISIRVIVGGGGSGKTRLAMDLCDRLSDVGWHAGFLSAAELPRFLAQQNLATWGWNRPTLVVIDDAAARGQALGAWLRELAGNPGESDQPLRLLLLERHADLNGGWWPEAFDSGDGSAYALQGILNPREPVRLQPLAPAARRQVLEAMLARLGSGERVPPAGAAPGFDEQLARLTWGGEPLYLMIAASRAAETGLGSLLALNRVELLKAVAGSERARLARQAQACDLAPEVLCHLAALVTLCGGLSWEALADAVPAELTALRRLDAHPAAELANALCAALPGPDGSVAAILPDAVGEAFVLDVLGSSRNAQGVVRRASALSGLAVADTLIRCAQDFGEAEGRVALQSLQSLADDLNEPAALDALLNRLPKSSVTLRKFAAGLSRRIVATLPGDDRSPEARVFMARSLHKLANRLSELGDRQGALVPVREAVEIRRELAANSPDTFRPDLASSLNNLAAFLSELGELQGALAPAREAVTIYRELAANTLDAHRPDLATSLNNLAIHLSELGDRQGALTPAREAVNLYRELVAHNPNVFRPGLAMSLNTLVNCLSEPGDRQSASALAREAVEIHRELAATNPDAFRPNLAISLNTLATQLRNRGDWQGALAPTHEAVAIYRELAANNPDAFRPDLSASLNNLAIQISELGDRESALASAREAVEIRRELAANNPDAFRRDLASSLNTLASRLSGLGDRQGALVLAHEAVEIHRELAANNPDAMRADLASLLNNLACFLSEMGERQGALAPAREALAIRRELVANNPLAFRTDLASSLHNLANCLSEVGDRQGALAPAREAVEIRRELTADNPDAFRADLASSLNNLATFLSELGDREGGLAPAHEAVETLAPAFLLCPQAFASWMATMVRNYRNRCADCDEELDEALLDSIAAALAVLQGDERT